VSGPSEERNKDVVLRFLRAAHRVDVATAAECLADDVVKHGPRPSSPMAAPVRGATAVLDAIPALLTLYEDTPQMEVGHVLAEGDLVSIDYVLRARTAKGEEYEDHYHPLFELRDGRITGFWEYIDTQYARRLFE
jgi:ketosteroid isomerase-like protein